MIVIEKDKALDAIGEVNPLDYNARATKARIEQLSTIDIVMCSECKYNLANPPFYADNALTVETYIHCQYMDRESKIGFCSMGRRIEDGID